MDTTQLESALAVAADAMRRCDPIYCAVMGVEQVNTSADLTLTNDDSVERLSQRAVEAFDELMAGSVA